MIKNTNGNNIFISDWLPPTCKDLSDLSIARKIKLEIELTKMINKYDTITFYFPYLFNITFNWFDELFGDILSNTNGVKLFKSKIRFNWKNDDFGREIGSVINKYDRGKI
jgi:hypothetical protein